MIGYFLLMDWDHNSIFVKNNVLMMLKKKKVTRNKRNGKEIIFKSTIFQEKDKKQSLLGNCRIFSFLNISCVWEAGRGKLNSCIFEVDGASSIWRSQVENGSSSAGFAPCGEMLGCILSHGALSRGPSAFREELAINSWPGQRAEMGWCGSSWHSWNRSLWFLCYFILLNWSWWVGWIPEIVVAHPHCHVI